MGFSKEMEFRLISAQFIFVFLLVLQGCSTTYMAVATFEDFNEVMLGEEKYNRLTSEAVFGFKGINTQLSCQGLASKLDVVPNTLTCKGFVGPGSVNCNDGRTIKFKWKTDSCTRSHGTGKDSLGNAFYFISGLDEVEANNYIKQKLKEMSYKPSLPTYHPQDARKENGFLTGTGFFVTNDGVMITSQHVIKDANKISVMDVDNGIQLPAELLASDPVNDIAIIKIEGKSKPIPLSGHSTLTTSDEVLALGYPLNTRQVQEQKMTFGRITSLSGVKGEERMMQIDVPLQPGNSGGPLLNKKGVAIGVIVTNNEEILLSRAGGSLPPNINLAVKIDYILPVLREALKGYVVTPDDYMSVMAMEQVVALRQPSIMLVISE